MRVHQDLSSPQGRPPSAALAHGAALAAVAVATGAALMADGAAHVPNLSLVFVLPVVLAAATYGWGPALTAAVAGVLAYNFFLIEPRYTLRVADPANGLALVLLLIVAAVVSAVAAEARRRAVQAREAAGQASALHGLAQGLVRERSSAGVAERCADALARLFHAPAVVLLQDEEALVSGGVAGGAVLSEADMDAARWSLVSKLPTRGGAYPEPDAVFDFWPLTSAQRRRAVIGIAVSGGDRGRPAAPERLVEIVAGYIAVALDREAYARQLLESRVQSASEKMKSDLLAAVSHDLKTPLSTVLLTLQSLQRFDLVHDSPTRAELLAGAEAETARLARMVDNLLDMNRLEAGALPVRPEPVRPDRLVAEALGRVAPALARHSVLNEAGEGRPLVVDPALFESALANVLENAGKYTPAGSRVRIRSGEDGEMGWIEVQDEGPGFDGSAEPLFGKFVRGKEDDGRSPGTGLGLSIARGFLEACGGRVEASDRSEGGACVRLIAPLAARP